MGNTVSVDIDAYVASVTLNRPAKMNAVTLEMFAELAAAGEQLAATPGVRAVVMNGAGENFCAGIDTAIFAGGPGSIDPSTLQPKASSPANLYQHAAYVWRELPVPVICAVHGAVFGGGMQIALGADLRYARPDSKFSIMEVKWGIIPDMGISTTSRGLLATDKLKELAFTGRVVAAPEALELGLISAIHEDPLDAARRIADEIAGRSPDAIRAMKKLFNVGLQSDEAAALALEARLQGPLLGGRNMQEAVLANIEKRAPKFSD
jgi:enoyl-CoA hydratase/carnithine racemase